MEGSTMFLRRVFPGLLAAALLAGLGGAARAQFAGRMLLAPSSPTTSDLLALLQRADVQQELHLDRHQAAVVADLADTFQEALGARMRGGFQAMQGLSAEERQRRMAERRAQAQAERTALQAQMNDKVRQLLHPEQLARLSQ